MTPCRPAADLVMPNTLIIGNYIRAGPIEHGVSTEPSVDGCERVRSIDKEIWCTEERLCFVPPILGFAAESVLADIAADLVGPDSQVPQRQAQFTSLFE